MHKNLHKSALKILLIVKRHIEDAQKPPQVRSQNMVDSIALRKTLQTLTPLN